MRPLLPLVALSLALAGCTPKDDAVARVYEAVGFRRVGTACVAEAD